MPQDNFHDLVQWLGFDGLGVTFALVAALWVLAWVLVALFGLRGGSPWSW